MPSYFYRARDTLGRAHEGIEVAASEDEVLRALSQMQLTPVLIEARGQAAGTAKARPSGAVAAPSAPRSWAQRSRCSRASWPR
jgi:type II secretory pathway component PulF